MNLSNMLFQSAKASILRWFDNKRSRRHHAARYLDHIADEANKLAKLWDNHVKEILLHDYSDIPCNPPILSSSYL